MTPAPMLESLKLRPFCNATLALCNELKLSFFTLEMFQGANVGDESALVGELLKIGSREVNRQVHTVLYMLGCDPLDTMLANIYRDDLYRAVVVPWMFTLPEDTGLVARALNAWVGFTAAYAAAQAKPIPKAAGTAPPAPEDAPAAA